MPEHPSSTLLGEISDVLKEMSLQQQALVSSLRTIRTERFGVTLPTDRRLEPATPVAMATATAMATVEMPVLVEPANTVPIDVTEQMPVSAVRPVVADEVREPIRPWQPVRSATRNYDFFSDLDEKLAQLANRDSINQNGHSNN